MLGKVQGKPRMDSQKTTDFKRWGVSVDFLLPLSQTMLCGGAPDYDPIRYGPVAPQIRNTSLNTAPAPVSSSFTNTTFRYCLKERTTPTRNDGLGRQQWEKRQRLLSQLNCDYFLAISERIVGLSKIDCCQLERISQITSL